MTTTVKSTIDQILKRAVEMGCSDIHISSESPTRIRVKGALLEIEIKEPGKKQIELWLKSMVNENQYSILVQEGDIDFSFTWEDSIRFRASAYMSQGSLTIALRKLNSVIPSMSELGLPTVVQNWAERQTGLVIVTGPTGSGKSTTVASLVNAANQSRGLHIVSIEDPVEYLLPEGKSLVHQREIGVDSPTFVRAVRASLREDVDVLVIGEMRDQETISAALTVAETGHLVFATLHTPSAASAIDRIIDAFDASEQPLIRSRLSMSLTGVVYQRLIKSQNGDLLAAFEVLVANYGIKNLIREGKTHQIPNQMTTGMNEGMRTMDFSVQEMIKTGKIDQAVGRDFLNQNT